MIYLVGGVARSGKSIVRKMLLEKFKISGIETDAIRAMLEFGLPTSDISDQKTPEQNAPLIWQYIKALIDHRLKCCTEDYVIEGDVLLPRFLNEYSDNPSVKTCFIGFSEIKEADKLVNMREFSSKNDWTAKISNEKTLELIKWLKVESKKYKKACLKYSVEYFDTSNNFIDVINQITTYLTKSV